jgi:FkbM family methyltransferase
MPHSVKVGVAKLLCRPVIGRVIAHLTGDAIPSQGVRIVTSARSMSPTTKAAIFWGLYETSELRFLRQYLVPDLDVVDLGASIGVAAAHAAPRLNSGARYLAVEANPSLQATLAHNLRSRPGSVVIATAVDATPNAGPTLALTLGETSVASRVQAGSAPGGRTCTVPRLTLGELLRQQNIGRYQLLCDNS